MNRQAWTHARPLVALVLLAVGLALTACSPPPSTTCTLVTDETGSTAGAPVDVEDFGVRCDEGGTVTVWVDVAGPLSAAAFEAPDSWPIAPGVAPAASRTDVAIVGQSSDNEDCYWEQAVEPSIVNLTCDETPSQGFLTSVTLDLGDRAGFIGFDGGAVNTVRGVS